MTGTPGTGKTKLAKSLASKGMGSYFNVKKKVEKKDFLKQGFDEKRDSIIVDEKKLGEYLDNVIRKSRRTLIIDSLLSHHASPDNTWVCFVLRCDPRELKTRLKKRKYSREKVRENMEAEALDLILAEAVNKGHRVHEIDTTDKKIDDTSKEAERVLKGKKKATYGNVRWI